MKNNLILSKQKNITVKWLLCQLKKVDWFHRHSQNFSKGGGGSHCVKVRVLVCLDIFKLKRHSIFATCSRLFG